MAFGLLLSTAQRYESELLGECDSGCRAVECLINCEGSKCQLKYMDRTGFGKCFARILLLSGSLRSKSEASESASINMAANVTMAWLDYVPVMPQTLRLSLKLSSFAS